MGTEEHLLEREARERPWAAVAAALAAALLIANIAVGSTLAGQPQPTKRLNRPDTERLNAHQLLFAHDHATAFTISAILTALSALAGAAALVFLYRAIKARRVETASAIVLAPVVGGVLFAAAGLAAQLTLLAHAGDFANAAHTLQHAYGSPPLLGRAYHAYHSGAFPITSEATLLGQLILGVGYVLVATAALRVGLLTRLMGIGGAVAGVVVVIPLGALAILQLLWLVALAVLLSGRWPGGLPLAWRTGRAEPLPTMAEQRERQAREREERQAGVADGPVSGAEQAVSRRLLGGAADRDAKEPARVGSAAGGRQGGPDATSASSGSGATRKRKRKRR